MSRRPHVAIALAGAALALSACGADASGTAAPAPSMTTSTTAITPTSTPTPTEISKEDAAAQYLAIVTPYNEANQHFKDVANTDAWDQVAFTDAATALADTNQAFVEGLLTSEWPATAQTTVTQLATDSAGLTSYMRELAQTTSMAEAELVAARAPEGGDNASAQLLRIQLGLDEAPVGTASATPSQGA